MTPEIWTPGSCEGGKEPGADCQSVWDSPQLGSTLDEEVRVRGLLGMAG